MTFPPDEQPYIGTDLEDSTDYTVSGCRVRILAVACTASLCAYVFESQAVRAWWAEIARLASKYVGVSLW